MRPGGAAGGVLTFLDYLVLLETYTNVRVLIQSEKTATMASERSLLKNLGTWLGSITLARNKPILHKVRACTSARRRRAASALAATER